MKEKKTITLNVDIINDLNKRAEIENRSFSNLMETICIIYLENNVH